MQHKRRLLAVAVAAASLGLASLAAGQDATPVPPAPATLTVWDLRFGSHARELPLSDFFEFSCGTNGGPPALVIEDWMDFGRCRPEPGTGLREVDFRYDDEPEYWARAQNLDMQLQLYQHTSLYGIPVILSALFDADGFYVGYRAVSDPRVNVNLREQGFSLGRSMRARYKVEGWTCTDLPRGPGESEYKGAFIKERCTKNGDDAGVALDLIIETRSFRRAGQAAIDLRDNTPTEGQFESSTYFQAVMAEPVRDRAQRLAEIRMLGPRAKDPTVLRAMNCPGCDLRGTDLKRANLARANLAGADLTGANLHAAILNGANLAGARLDGANINRANLRQANLESADLQKAMLYASVLDGANLSGANLTSALAGKAQFIRANLARATVVAADLRDARLHDANLQDAMLAQSWLHHAQLNRANLAGVNLVYVIGWQANFTGANLTAVDARGADFYGSNLREADLTGADFSFTRLEAANLFAAKLSGAQFEGAELPAGFVKPE
jgi:uncharacterized protein YjbI with pentapeptide repeats